MKAFAIGVLVVLGLVNPAIAQVSISMNDYAAQLTPGKSWRTLASDAKVNIPMNIGPASATQAQAWSVPAVAFVDTFRTDNMVPSGTPYFSRFPSATHAQRFVTVESGSQLTSYAYYRLANDSLIILGGAATIKAQGFDTTYFNLEPVFAARFPLTMGYSWTSRDSTVFGSGYVITTSTQTIDAFGSLATSVGTFQCLRLREISISQTVIPGFPIPPDTSITFDWITREGVSFNGFLAEGAPTSGPTTLEFVTFTTETTTPVNVAESAQEPVTFKLLQNYPNPFNPSTTIEYELGRESQTRLSVLKILGEEIAVLVNERRSAGRHRVSFNAGDFPTGVYFYKLQADGRIEVGRMSLLK